MDNILASAIKYKEHLNAFDATSADRFYQINLAVFIPALLDVVPVEALPYLALQFGVSGYTGWRYADTEQKQRDLLKNAIKINRLKGTEYAIVEALKMINMTPVTIVKGQYRLYCNGEQFIGGNFKCGDPNPFVFQVQVKDVDFPAITAQTAIDMLAIISTFKAARDLLVSVDYSTTAVSDSCALTDQVSIDVDNGHGVTNYIL